MLPVLTGLRRLLGWRLRCFKQWRNDRSVRLNYLSSNIDTSFEEYVSVGERSVLYRTRMGRFSYCGSNCQIAHCQVGRFCSIGSNVRTGLWKHPVASNVSTHPVFYSSLGQASGEIWGGELEIEEFAFTTIGSDVWIGDNVLIMGGITIGDGAVVGAGAIVTKNVAPYTVCAGVPAKPLRTRFCQEEVELLLRIRWWDWPVEKIKENRVAFSDISRFLRRVDDAG